MRVLIFVLIFFWSGVVFAGNGEIVGNFGYHIWSQSGHTFAKSDKGDKTWNGLTYQLEGTFWWDNIGWYGYLGKDKQIREEMYEDRYFKANVYYFGTGLKVRKEFYNWLIGYLGTGLNYTISKQKYVWGDGSDWGPSETLDNVGPDILAGVQLRHGTGWFSSLSARYSWNREMSKTYNKTTFDPGGLRLWIGLGYSF